jgi:hypothetical protein
MGTSESQLVPYNLNPQSQSEESSEKGTDIIWQVHKISFSDLPNLFEAVPRIINNINSMMASSSASESEKWLFTEEDDLAEISFMIFEDEVGNTVCLVYNSAFIIRALSVGNGVLIRLGKMHIDIFHQYNIAKSKTQEEVFEPQEFLLGSIVPDKDGFFTLSNVFLNGFDCREQFEAAMAIPGFPTEAYETISWLDKYSQDYRNHLIGKLYDKYGKYIPKGLYDKEEKE